MKKVMFLFVGMLFAVNVNAATFELTGATEAQGENEVTSFVFNAEGEQKWYFETSENSAVAFEFGWTPITQSSTVNFTGGSISEIYSAVLGKTVFTLSLLKDVVYEIVIADAALVTTINASAVPLPAALFLFAPALIGLFSLRRKAIA